MLRFLLVFGALVALSIATLVALGLSVFHVKAAGVIFIIYGITVMVMADSLLKTMKVLNSAILLFIVGLILVLA